MSSEVWEEELKDEDEIEAGDDDDDDDDAEDRRSCESRSLCAPLDQSARLFAMEAGREARRRLCSLQASPASLANMTPVSSTQ